MTIPADQVISTMSAFDVRYCHNHAQSCMKMQMMAAFNNKLSVSIFSGAEVGIVCKKNQTEDNDP